MSAVHELNHRMHVSGSVPSARVRAASGKSGGADGRVRPKRDGGLGRETMVCRRTAASEWPGARRAWAVARCSWGATELVRRLATGPIAWAVTVRVALHGNQVGAA